MHTKEHKQIRILGNKTTQPNVNKHTHAKANVNINKQTHWNAKGNEYIHTNKNTY